MMLASEGQGEGEGEGYSQGQGVVKVKKSGVKRKRVIAPVGDDDDDLQDITMGGRYSNSTSMNEGGGRGTASKRRASDSTNGSDSNGDRSSRLDFLVNFALSGN